MKDCANCDAKRCITLVAMMAQLFFYAGTLRISAIRANWFNCPFDFFEVINTLFFGGKLLEDFY
jgi:hypothetical protein